MDTLFESQKLTDETMQNRDFSSPLNFEQVIQTLLEKVKDDDEETADNAFEFQIPEFVGLSLDLTKRNMFTFPTELLNKSQQVQYLYLESNKLTELPDCFFQKLSSLKWLDLRNNNLESLPTLGLKDNPTLEVLLLQGNRIKNLPLELASIPHLKGLQISGNPIENVPFEVIADGFQAIMKHLKKTSSRENILLPVSEKIVVKPSSGKEDANQTAHRMDSRISDLENSAQRKARRKITKKKSTEIKLPFNNFSYSKIKEDDQKKINESPKESEITKSDSKKSEEPDVSSCPNVCGKRKLKVISSTHHYVKQRKTRLGYKRKPMTLATLQEKAVKEICRAQMRETLEKQAQKIQRMK